MRRGRGEDAASSLFTAAAQFRMISLSTLIGRLIIASIASATQSAGVASGDAPACVYGGGHMYGHVRGRERQARAQASPSAVTSVGAVATSAPSGTT